LSGEHHESFDPPIVPRALTVAADSIAAGEA